MSPLDRNLVIVLALVLLFACIGIKAESRWPSTVAKRFTIRECRNLNGSPEPCLWWYRARPEQQKASKLVIFFAGGDQSCGIWGSEHFPIVYGTVAAEYVKNGYVFACANLYVQSDLPSRNHFPYYLEVQRVDLLIKTITQNASVKRYWNGKELLLSGVSHGASAPTITMFRTDYDQKPHWHGSQKTAACFLDGVYDIYYNQNFYLESNDILCSTRVIDRNVCTRYVESEPCELPQENNYHMDQDSVVNMGLVADVNNLAVKKWRIVEGGSKLPCLLDLAPALPQKDLCDAIASSSNHDCDYVSLPNMDHFQCGVAKMAHTQCRSWFNNL